MQDKTSNVEARLVPESTMLGLSASVKNLLRTVGPTAGGYLYMNYGQSSIGLIQFLVNMVVFVYLLLRPLKRTEARKE
ncbi:putative solute carrier family 22 member 18 [Scophthalmus maximus]|uniref:Putative solute carrier family 22 member 18 n=1 Tax=Scophthalmus maximus TaxID=52904 RepID=A0A2U9BB39_SCOMX|nr:putative solute carrier family 22 member 18 [Scophthalmus maximus]